MTLRYNLNILVAEFFGDHARGEWETIDELDRNLLNASVRIGKFFYVAACWRWYGHVKSDQGEFAPAKEAQDKLQEIGETYDHAFSLLAALWLKTVYLTVVRSAREAISVADKGISYAREMDNVIYEILLLGHKAEAKQLTGDTEGARDSLSQASNLQKKQRFILPYYTMPLI